jgi:hypothetical protein
VAQRLRTTRALRGSARVQLCQRSHVTLGPLSISQPTFFIWFLLAVVEVLVVTPRAIFRRTASEGMGGPSKIIGVTAAGIVSIGIAWILIQVLMRVLLTSNYNIPGYFNGYPLDDDNWGEQFKPLFMLEDQQKVQEESAWFERASYSYNGDAATSNGDSYNGDLYNDSAAAGNNTTNTSNDDSYNGGLL